MTFTASEHVIIMERKSKKKDAQGHDTWEVTKTEYLPVQWRLYWFRQENPKGKIDSHVITLDLEKGAAVFETYVEREDGGSARMHGSETASDWKDYIEKAQTKSLGRALAAVGYGSQFTGDEFVEGERIVDSPVARHNGQEEVQKPQRLGVRQARLEDIKRQVLQLKLATDPETWAAWKKKVIFEDLPDVRLTDEHLDAMQEALDLRPD